MRSAALLVALCALLVSTCATEVSSEPKKNGVASGEQLAGVIVKAVRLMDGGIQQFLRDQARDDMAYSQNSAMSSVDEVAHMSESNKKALAVIKQMSQNFHGLEQVVKKLQAVHDPKNADVKVSKSLEEQVEALTRENKQLMEDKSQMTATVQELVQHSQECEDQLQDNKAGGADAQEHEEDQDQEGNGLSGKAMASADATKLKLLIKENQALRDKLNKTVEAGRALEGEEEDDRTRASGLENQIGELKRQNADLKTDKAGLVSSVQQMLANSNAFKLETSMKESKEAEAELRQKYEKKMEALKKREEEIQDKSDDAREVLQQLQAQNVDLEKSNGALKSELAESQKKATELSSDKGHLMESLQNLLRQNTQYQNQIADMKRKLQEAKKPKPAARKNLEKVQRDEQEEAEEPVPVLKKDPSANADPIKSMGETEVMTHYIDRTANIMQEEPERKSFRAKKSRAVKKVNEAAERALKSERAPLAGYLDGGIPRGPEPDAQKEAPPTTVAVARRSEEAPPPSTDGNDDAAYEDTASKLLEQAESEINDADSPSQDPSSF